MQNLESLPKKENLSGIAIPKDVVEDLKKGLWNEFHKYMDVLEKEVLSKQDGELLGLNLNIHTTEIYEQAGFHLHPDYKENVLETFHDTANQAKQLMIAEKIPKELYDQVYKRYTDLKNSQKADQTI